MGISTDTIISNSAVRTVFLAIFSVTAIMALAACSSNPVEAPWKQADDSPWSSKRGSDDNNVYGNFATTEAAATDPVLIAETEPEVVPLESTPPAVIKPVPVVEIAVVAAAVGHPSTAEQQVLAMDPASYAVQVYASTTEESMQRFKTNKEMENLMVVRTNREGKTVYVLIDVHDDLETAKQAAGYLEKKSGAKPWVRSIAGLQKIVDVR